MFSFSPEIVFLFIASIVINFAFIYWYVAKKISLLRLERINEYLTIKEREFQQRFNNGLKDFREVSLNLQHDFKRLDRLREGMDGAFQVIENKINDINTHSKNLEKTASFYQELKDTIITNNAQLQTMFAKLKNFETDMGTKEGILAELSLDIEQLKNEFDEKFREAKNEIKSGFTQIENLGKVNSAKIKSDYEDVLADFKDSIDVFMKEEKQYISGEVENLQLDIKGGINQLQGELNNEDERLDELKERYQQWEKDLTGFQEKNQTRIHEFSEKILSSFKEKIDDYQNEILTLLEQKQGKLMAQTEDLIKRNQNKQVVVDDLSAFVEQAKSTVTYQIDNLANFLEQQKKQQAELYQKNQVVLVDTFTKIKTELTDFREDMNEVRKTKKKIFDEIDSYIDIKMKDTMEHEAPQVLEKIFEVNFGSPTANSTKGAKKDFLSKFTKLVDTRAKESVMGQTSEILAKLENQGEWEKFLEQQTADTLLKKLKVDNIFSRVKENISKEFLRKELREEIKDYRKQVGDISKDWSKLTVDLEEQKKFLDRLLIQGEDKVEELLEKMKLNLSEKQQELQDLFNKKIIEMETKMSTVTGQIDFFLIKSKSLEKVFVFQKEFSESISSYNQQLRNLKKANERFEEFNQKFDRFEQDSKRLNNMQKGVVEKQAEMQNLQKQLDSVMSMTEEIEKNIVAVRQHSKEVNEFLKKVQTHSKEVDKIKNAISTVREIEEDSKTVKEWVSEIKAQAEQNLNKAEQFLGKVNVGEELQKKITQQLKLIEDQSLRLDEKYQSLQNFNKKFDEFDMAVYDVEQRIKVIDELKKEMAVEQENLSKLKESFNEQISILIKVITNQKDGDPKLFSELDKQFKSLPKTLSTIGWSDKEIAKHLNMELFEVQVLLNNKKHKK